MREIATEPDLFRPDGARAKSLADRLRLRLAASFDHLLEACAPHLPLDDVSIERAIERVRAASRVRPEIFILHRQCVEAARDGDLDDLARTFHAFCTAEIAAPLTPVRRNWGDPSFSEAELDRYRQVFGAEGDTPIAFEPAPAPTFEQASRSLAGALDLLRRTTPELAGEITALVGEIVFAQGKAGAGMTFDGVTAFFASGALLLNAAEHRTVPSALAGLVHEAAHALMFAITEGAPLVTNGPGERYPSPLRRDPRPMNGVFHATIVSARMAYALDAALQAGAFTGADSAEAEDLRNGARQAFGAGLATVEAHAHPTPDGQALLKGARRYMLERAALP